MYNKVIITESRTIAKTIAQAIGVNILRKGYFGKGDTAVTWTGGNIITATPKSKFEFSVCSDMTADEIFAANFDFNIRTESKGKGPKKYRRPTEKDLAQAGVISRLWHDADMVYNAMKPSASGEVAFACVANHIRTPRKTARLWLRSVTRRDILDALGHTEESLDGYAAFHDNAIAEFAIGARPLADNSTVGDTSENEGLWTMDSLKHECLTHRGWSPSKTTGVAYSLYNKGLISFPSEDNAPLPASALASMKYAIQNLRHHPLLGHKTMSAAVPCNDTAKQPDGIAHHGIIITGLYPVDLTPEEESLYDSIAGHCLDLLSAPRQSGL